MQIKLFHISISDNEDELNRFIRSHKVLEVQSEFVSNGSNSAWCFCIKYIENGSSDAIKKQNARKKIDYKEILDEITFKKFTILREIRKHIASDEGIPAFAIFIDEELASIAKLNEISSTSLKSIKGLGQKKVEKYGSKLIEMWNEKLSDSNADKS